MSYGTEDHVTQNSQIRTNTYCLFSLMQNLDFKKKWNKKGSLWKEGKQEMVTREWTWAMYMANTYENFIIKLNIITLNMYKCCYPLKGTLWKFKIIYKNKILSLERYFNIRQERAPTSLQVIAQETQWYHSISKISCLFQFTLLCIKLFINYLAGVSKQCYIISFRDSQESLSDFCRVALVCWFGNVWTCTL